jgi:L-alanine-DL-glutamate epimerase-like enolase superfamily enzyme
MYAKTALEVFVLRAPAGPHQPGHFSVATANEIPVRLRTSDGVEIGPRRAMLRRAGRQAFRAGVGEQILGTTRSRRAAARKLALTWGRWRTKRLESEALIRIAAAVDIARWDIVGKRPDCRCIACSADTASRALLCHALTTVTARTSSNAR